MPYGVFTIEIDMVPIGCSVGRPAGRSWPARIGSGPSSSGGSARLATYTRVPSGVAALRWSPRLHRAGLGGVAKARGDPAGVEVS